MMDAASQRPATWMAIVASTLLGLGASACDRPVKTPRAEAIAPTPPASSHIVVLPDSAIAVETGSPEEKLAQYLASPAPAPRTFRFEGTEFAPWASKPTPATERTMYVMTQILRAYPKVRVSLAGYTDNDGTAEQNLVLARQRVDRLAEILVHGGVRANRIDTVGKGAVDFVADNATVAGRARNRRIEITVTAK